MDKRLIALLLQLIWCCEAGTLPTIFPESPPSLPEEFSWQEIIDTVPAPPTQGPKCNSSWAWAAIGALEGVCTLSGYDPSLRLSAQQLIDCVTQSAGCSGGSPSSVYDYIISSGGLESAQEYPYKGVQSSCFTQPADFSDCSMNVTSYFSLNFTQHADSVAESMLQKFVFDTSPVAVCLDRTAFHLVNERNGWLVNASSCGTVQNHCVLVVGWRVLKGVIAWIAQNSFGPAWGDQGFFYIETGANTCNILGRNSSGYSGGYFPTAPFALQRGTGPQKKKKNEYY